MFESARDWSRGLENLRDFLQTLTRINWRYLRDNPETPLLYHSGVRYQDEPYGVEQWKDIPTLYRDRFGDCEDLACARAAELQRAGIAAEATFKHKPIVIRNPRTGGRENVTLFHILVRHPTGELEDPSRRLGMGKNPSHIAALISAAR